MKKKENGRLPVVAGRNTALPSSSPAEDRRSEARGKTDYNASCIMHTVNYNVELLDLSQSGARVRLRQGLMPCVGQKIAIGLMNGRVLDCVVSWVDDIEAGLQFDSKIPDVVDCAHFDEMGSEFYKSVLKYQIAKAAD